MHIYRQRQQAGFVGYILQRTVNIVVEEQLRTTYVHRIFGGGTKVGTRNRGLIGQGGPGAGPSERIRNGILDPDTGISRASSYHSPIFFTDAHSDGSLPIGTCLLEPRTDGRSITCDVDQVIGSRSHQCSPSPLFSFSWGTAVLAAGRRDDLPSLTCEPQLSSPAAPTLQLPSERNLPPPR